MQGPDDERLRDARHGELVPARARKAPIQRRSRELVDSLLEATRIILEREGEEALTTNRIAEVAGASVGSLYQYFPDKEALIDALFERETEQSLRDRVEWARDALAMPLEEMLRMFLGGMVAQHRRMLSLHTALYREQQTRSGARQIGDALAPTNPGGVHVVESFLGEWFARHPSEIRPANLEHVAFLVDRVGYAMMRATLDERPDYLRDQAFVEEMVQLLLRYLRANPPADQGDTGARST